MCEFVPAVPGTLPCLLLPALDTGKLPPQRGQSLSPECCRGVCSKGAVPKGLPSLDAICPHLAPHLLAPWEGKKNKLFGGGLEKP